MRSSSYAFELCGFCLDWKYSIGKMLILAFGAFFGILLVEQSTFLNKIPFKMLTLRRYSFENNFIFEFDLAQKWFPYKNSEYHIMKWDGAQTILWRPLKK